jgi:uncharacterized membrane protein YgcG
MRFLKLSFVFYLTLILILPTQLCAGEELDRYMAKSEAEGAANRDVNKACWFGAGMTIIGTGVAMIWHSSSPDPAAFAGRSPEYIRAYTDAYRARVRRNQTMYSCIGCGFILTMAGCAITLIEINEGCQETQSGCAYYESCLNDCSSSSAETEETSSCGEGSSCGSGSEGSSCGEGSSGG